MRRFALALVCLATMFAAAAQFKRFGDWEVHYIAFNTATLSPQMAKRYDIVRGPTKGLVNISAVGDAGRGEKVRVQGRFVDLLGKSEPLAFREIHDRNSDGDSTYYYLAVFDFPHAETLRFEIIVDLPDHGTETVRFQQALHRSVPEGGRRSAT